MAERINELSCFTSSLLIAYARGKGVADSVIFDGVDVPSEVLRNSLEWTDVQTWSRLATNVERALGGPGTLEEAGAQAPLLELKSYQVLFLRLSPLPVLVDRLSRHVRTHIDRNLAVRLEVIHDGEAELSLRPVVPSRYSRQMCDFTRGMVMALMRLKGYVDPSIEETGCAVDEGHNECQYRLRWRPRARFLHRLREYLSYRVRGQKVLLDSMEDRFLRLKRQYDAAKRAETALRRSEARFRAIFENIQDVYIEATQDGRILEVSPSVEALTGWRRDELFGMYISELFADEQERQHFLEHLQAQERVADHEIHVRDRKGRSIVCSMAAVMTRDKDGKPYKLSATVRNISERKAGEQAVRESEMRFRQLADNIDEVFWLCSADWTEVHYVSPAFAKVWGLSAEVLYQDPDVLLDTVLPDDRPSVEQWRSRASSPGTPAACEYRISRPDGSVAWVSSRLYPIEGAGGEVVRVAGISRDVSAQVQAAQDKRLMEEQLAQAQKMDAIGQLAGGIAHDFNNQLAGVMGFAELLREELARDDKLATYVDYILLGARRAAELTSKLLAFARKGKYQSVPVNLHRLIGEVVSLLEHSIDKRIRIVQVLAANPATSKGDPTQLQNAILNLSLNARDAMAEGGELTIATDVVSIDERMRGGLPFDVKTGRYVRVAVKDTGIGMDAEVQKHMFEPFFTTKKEGKGTGMGLASVYGTAKNHHGTVTFSSAPGRGTTFELYLPLALGEPEIAPPPPKAVSAGPARVLVIDDDETFRSVALATLHSLGYEAVCYGDGAATLERYRAEWQRFDLVLLDMIMPNMDGRATFKALREVNPQAKVLLSSGYSLDGRAQEVLELGACGFIQKPFKRSDLASKVAEALGGGPALPGE